MERLPRIGWIATTLVVGLATLGAANRDIQRPDPRGNDDPVLPLEEMPGDDPRFEGHITAVDPGRREIRVDFGRTNGAEAGMILEVWRPVPDPAPGFGDRFRVGWLELTSVGDRQSTARAINLEPDDTFRLKSDEPRPGDQVIDATDRETFRILKLATGDRPDAVDEIAKARLPVARRRLELATAYYGEGSITIDRLTDASRGLMEAERDAAGTRDERLAAIRGHLERMNGLVTREASRFLSGSGSLPNLAEARGVLAEAASILARARREDAGER